VGHVRSLYENKQRFRVLEAVDNGLRASRKLSVAIRRYHEQSLGMTCPMAVPPAASSLFKSCDIGGSCCSLSSRTSRSCGRQMQLAFRNFTLCHRRFKVRRIREQASHQRSAANNNSGVPNSKLEVTLLHSANTGGLLHLSTLLIGYHRQWPRKPQIPSS
jgi:hypothetical protein